jgi:hypothetical protein
MRDVPATAAARTPAIRVFHRVLTMLPLFVSWNVVEASTSSESHLFSAFTGRTLQSMAHSKSMAWTLDVVTTASGVGNNLHQANDNVQSRSALATTL